MKQQFHYFGLILFSAIIVAVVGQESSIGGQCTTPRQESGLCIKLRDCPSFTGLLLSARTNPAHLSLLHASRCAISEKASYACCPGLKPTTQSNSNTAPTLIDPVQGAKLLPLRNVCGQQTAKHIVGGEITKIDEFPWMAQLWYTNLYYNTEAASCAGTLINYDHIVTAAHCVHPQILNKNQLRLEFVRLGEWNTSSSTDCTENNDCSPKPLDIKIDHIFVHEDYIPNAVSREADIALIRLQSKVPLSDFIRPICLPTSDSLRNKNFEGEAFYAAGWGKTGSGKKSDVKLKVAIKGVGDKVCVDFYRQHQLNLGKRHLCAGGVKGFDTCSGDSGAPLMGYDESDPSNRAWYLAGVVSFGPDECGSENYPGVYTRVNQFNDWILSRLR